MITVQAMAIGADIAAFPCEGKVDAVFARACVAALEDGRRLTVLGGDRDRGMRMAVVTETDWDRIRGGFKIGRKVRLGPGFCETGEIRVIWAETGIWHTPEMPGFVPEDGWQSGLAHASARLEILQRPLASSLLWAAAHRRFERVCEVLEKEQPLDGAIVNLIGAGPGLTPSGDDFLGGLMAGLAAGGDGRFAAVRRAVLANLAGTTTTSRDYLEQAANGWWTQGLHRLFSAIGNDSEAIADACDILAACGHSSGLDLAAGLIAGLRSAAGRRFSPVSTFHDAAPSRVQHDCK